MAMCGQVLELTGCVKPVKCSPLKIEPCERDNLVMHWESHAYFSHAFAVGEVATVGKFATVYSGTWPLSTMLSMLMCWGMLGCGGHTDSQGQIIMLWCETTDSPHLCTMFLHISFIFFHIFLSFPFFLIVIFGLKESNRPTGWKFVLHRMQAAFFRCILLGLLSRAKLRATQTLHVSWARRARLGVEHVEYSEYSNRGWQHGSDNTVGLRPVHMSLLGSPGTWLSHAFQCFSKVRICHTVSDTTWHCVKDIWLKYDWHVCRLWQSFG